MFLELSAGGKIGVAIAVIVAVAVIMGILIAVISSKFKVEADPRADKMNSMMPGANCGGCGYPGCSGLVDAVISGEVKKITTCKVIAKDKAQEVVDYLNSTPGPDGSTLKVEL